MKLKKKLKSGSIKPNEYHDFKWISFENLFETYLAEADKKLIQPLKISKY